MQDLFARHKNRDYHNDVLNDDFYLEIINSLAFKRLKNISFLGAIDYAITPKYIKKDQRTRYAHSLGVASLAIFVSKKNKYDKELERHLVAAALLHDIGHAPLSHSIEPMFKSKWGLNHHDIGESIIKGEIKRITKLKKIIDAKLDRSFLLELIEGNYTGEGGNLFSNQINIDTIDGIIRASRYTNRQLLCPFSIANIAFDKNIINTSLLDDFWKLKHTVYHTFILSGVGLKTDIISQQHFPQYENEFSKEDFFSHEKIWKKKYSSLFDSLISLQKSNVISNLDGNEVNVTKRHYTVVDTHSSDESRYVCDKEESTYKFPDKTFQEEKQALLPLGV